LSLLIKRLGLTLAITCVAAMSMVSSAFAAQDYGDLTSGFGAELTAAVPVALTAVGLLVGILLAYKVVRKMIRA
jgi:hypothetical protein